MVELQQPRRPSWLKRFLIALADIITYRLLGGWRREAIVEKRVERIILNIVKSIPPSTPYVIDGKWGWCQDSTGYHPSITIVLPDLGIVCAAFGPAVGSWDVCKYRCKNKQEWEEANRIAALIENKCTENGLLFLGIRWDDPIDEESLVASMNRLLAEGGKTLNES